jgi:zinc protease
VKKILIISVLLVSFVSPSKGEIESMYIEKKTLENGLTVLVRQNHTVPKVSVQLWYNVGSKDEKDGEKGRAHLIEHMIFKGTKEMLSETDIKVLTHMLSGDCNAFTSYDFTGYLFNLPSQNWRAILPVMADCMVNAAFNDEHLNSEMKAVIQELKMLKDRHVQSLIYDLLTAIFPDHPYHYPLIGYKQDLWSARGKDLERFYKQHYIPNNATLVVVGDVEAQEVFDLAEQYFGAIPANFDYIKEVFYHNPDIGCKSVTLYRDIQQPTALMAYVTPGATARTSDVIHVLSLILSGGKNSRLYKRLVDGVQLVSGVNATFIELFDYSLFLILFSPKEQKDIPEIERIIAQEIQDIIDQGLDSDELQGVLKKAKMLEYAILEKNESQALSIGKNFLALGDPAYGFTYLDVQPDKLEADLKEFLARYMRPSVTHKGLILPLSEHDKTYWLQLQQESDAQDMQVLSAHPRQAPVELPRYAHTVKAEQALEFNFPKAHIAHLSNGMKLLWYDNKQTPKINIDIVFKADDSYDPDTQQGLYDFVTRMMTEGTVRYSGPELAHELESRGINIDVAPGGISMAFLKEDFEKALELVYEILMNATFPESSIEKIRSQMLIDLKMYWDNPNSFARQLMQEIIYAGHPFSKNALGSPESVSSITQTDLISFYKKYISPHGATCSIVGDLPQNMQAIVERVLGAWQGPEVADLLYPALRDEAPRELNYPINRDQVVLLLGRSSVARKDPDFDKLVIFDQIFGGSLHSRLFQLREQSGLFYSISGSTTAQAALQRGMVLIRTLVSVDRMQEAEKAIKHMMTEVVDTLTEEDIARAKDALANGLVGFFDSNTNISQAFLFLDKYGFDADYFDHRAKALAGITLQEVKDAVRPYMDSSKLNVIRVGRV